MLATSRSSLLTVTVIGRGTRLSKIAIARLLLGSMAGVG